MTSSYAVGQKVELNDGRVAIVRFAGTTSFQQGDWIGVELDEATGKNDGSVKGVRYFECEQGYGMFLRAAGIRKVVENAKQKANGVPSKPTAATKGGVNGVKRQSIVRGSSLAESPTPGARSAAGLSGIRSPVGTSKSPTKQLGSYGGVSSSATSSRTSTPPVGKKPSVASTTNATSKPPMGLQPSTSTPTGRRTSGMPAPSLAGTNRASRPSLAPPGASRGLTARGSALGTGVARTAGKQDIGAIEETGSEVGSEQTDLNSSQGAPASEISSSQDASPPEATNGERHADNEDEQQEDETIRFAPPLPPPVPPDLPQISPTSTNSKPRRPSSPAAASMHSQRTIRSTAASNKQIEELEAKVRILERKRVEDRGVKKTLEAAQAERDQYKGIIEKLQTKMRPHQKEVTELKQALAEAEKRANDMESGQAEHESVLEMATLDREMAEETADGLKAELEALRAHNEEVQLELDILREENADLTKEMSPEERESAGWMQLQHSNDRLRNALLALRDRAVDEKAELMERIESLTEQGTQLEGLKGQHEEAKERLLKSEADVDDLKQQLEVALQAEEMIEELTERNGRLEGNVDEMRATIEDLENLKELNDELEINHVEAEKQMQEEIDFKDSLLLDRERTAKLQQETLDSKDDTIRQFRNLVSTLQADMTDMKASKQMSETEAKDLEDKSRAMLDLNMRLQSSAAKTQVKAIDLELRKMEAQEAGEHLEIVRLFLPEAFHAERDSVLALLRFKRIAFKANLVHGFIRERLSGSGAHDLQDDLFAACDVLDKLTWIAAMSDRFINAVRSCGVEEFGSFEPTLYELEPVERALDSHIDALRRDEVHETDVAEELKRSIAVMEHLATLHIKGDDLASHADELIMRVLVLQSQLESAATALQLSKTMVGRNVQKSLDEDDDDDEGSASDLAIILNRAETLMNHTRSAKVVVGKMHRTLVELQARSLTLGTLHDESFDGTAAIVANVAKYARESGTALQSIFGEEGRNEAFTPGEVAVVLSRVAVTIFSLQAPEAGPFNALRDRLGRLTESVSELAALPNDLDNTIEFERGTSEPWVARANEIKHTKISERDTEAELARTLEALRGKDGEVKTKETELEEQQVKIEMFEARLKDASKRASRIGELEKAVHEAKEAERRARREAEKAREEKDREMERAREEMGRLGQQRKKSVTGAGFELDDAAMGAGAMMNAKRMDQKITSLEGAVRHLKDENHRLRLPQPDSPLSTQTTLAWLHEPLIKQKSEGRIRQENVQKESKDVLQRLLSLSASADAAQLVDLTRLPENRLAWRPARDTSRWKIERRKEEWEGWKSWRRDVVRLGAGFKAPYKVERMAAQESS